MISPEEMRMRIGRVREDMIRTRARDMLVIGLDMVALVKRRVINTGVDSEGQSFGVYSQAYQRQRSRENLTEKPFPARNFKRTTRMWNNTTASIIKESKEDVTVRLAPVTQEEIDKLEYNETLTGKEIMKTSDRENKLLRRSIEARYKRILIINNII